MFRFTYNESKERRRRIIYHSIVVINLSIAFFASVFIAVRYAESCYLSNLEIKADEEIYDHDRMLRKATDMIPRCAVSLLLFESNELWNVDAC